MVVHNLYLLDKDGISLVDVTVGSLKIEPNLASGYFMAIIKFIKELVKSDEEVITDMGMRNNRLYFVYEPPLVGVIAVDSNDDKEEVTSVMKYILQEFQRKYDLKNWDYDAYPFRKFSNHMKSKIEQYYNEIMDKIFYEAFKIYSKYKKYGLDEEWNDKINQFQQEFGPQFMVITGTVFDYMGSKMMQDIDIREPEYDPETQLIISDTNINIWNKDLLLLFKDAMESLHEIDAYFTEKYHN